MSQERLDLTNYSVGWQDKPLLVEARRAQSEVDSLKEENKLLREQALRFANALVDVMDGHQDHDVQSHTGLSEDACDRVCAVRMEAQQLINTKEN